MKNKIQLFIALLAVIAINNLQAQDRPTIEPKLTEVWVPVPAKVTPGDQQQCALRCHRSF
ncbi:MAG: hypothetical protein U5K79_03390 [Cyclobacteriaceae bacterium]|nr:hypothetical protein [Cyclobacteriaceae bacterium]